MAGAREIAAPGVEAIRDTGRLAAIVPEWEALVRDAAEANPLYEPAMALPASLHLAAGGEIVWLAVWREGGGKQLIGLFPVVTRRFLALLPIRFSALWHHELGFLTTPLVHRDFLNEACEAFADRLTGEEGGARIFMQSLAAAAGPVHRALHEALAGRGCRLHAFNERSRAILECNVPAEAYFDESGHGNRLRTYRRQKRRLAELGDLVFEMVEPGENLAAAAEDFLALEVAGWKGRRGTAMARLPAQRAFFDEAAASWAREGKARIARLRLDRRTIASLVLLVSGDRAWTWKIAFDERLSHFSPGVVLMIELTRALLDEKACRSVDSCAPADYPMIDRIWRERLPLVDLMADLHPAGVSSGILFAAEGLRRRLLHLLKRLANAVRRH